MIRLSFLAIACLLAAGAARAQVNPVEETISRLAERYEMPEDELAELYDQGIGWGEIGRAVAVANKADRPLREIVELRRSARGWRRVMDRYDLDVWEVRREAVRIAEEGLRAERREAGRERLPPREKRGRGYWPPHERIHRDNPMRERMRKDERLP